jgi:hypothetical protein
VSFPYLGSACLNFIRAQARTELKDEPKNRARAQTYNKSSRAKPTRKLALIFNLIFLFINLIFYNKFKL